MFDAHFVSCHSVCREVWDDTGMVTNTTEVCASKLQEQLSQGTLTVTSIPQHPCQSFQGRPNEEQRNPTSVQPTVSAPLPSSLLSSVNRQADLSAGLLAQLQQLVESYRVPDQASLDVMNWFSQEMLNSNIPHTLGFPSQQVWRHADSVHISSSTNSSTSEAHMYSTQNNSRVLQAALAVAAHLPVTLCSQETFHPVAAAVQTDQAVSSMSVDHQYVIGELQPPPSFTDCVYQLSLLTRLQQMYLESVTNAQHYLHVLQQQVIPPASATVDSDGTPSSNSASFGTSEDTVHSQSSDYVPHSG